MIKQFSNISSWRQYDITIEAHEVYTLNFRDTRPNTFTFINPNNATLKIATRSIPHEGKYEWKIEGNTTESYAQPIGTNNLYILNDSSLTVDLMVFTVEKDFDPVILKNTNVNVSDVSMEVGTEISGFADGIKLDVNDPQVGDLISKLLSSSTPSGLTNLASLLTQLSSILSGINTLTGSNAVDGKTNLYSLYNRINQLSQGSTVSGQVNLFDLGNKLDTVRSAIGDVVTALGGQPTEYSDAVYLNNVIEFSYTAQSDETIVFPYIMNDGGTTANINRNGSPILTMLENEYFCDLEIRLVAGDVITITSDQPLYRIKYYTRAV